MAAADKAGAIVPVSTGSWKERYSKKPNGSALGSVDGVAPTLKNIQAGSFPFSRFLYNVYCAGDPANGNKCGTANPSSSAVTSYVGETGWICKANAQGGSDQRDELPHGDRVRDHQLRVRAAPAGTGRRRFDRHQLLPVVHELAG